MKLTDAAVRNMKVGELRDDKITGLYVRVARGKKRWYYRYSSGDSRPTMRLGTYPEVTLGGARRMASEIVRRIAAGEDPARDRRRKRTALTVAELMDRAIEQHYEVRAKPKTVEAVRRASRIRIVPQLGSMRVADVDRADIVLWHQSLAKHPIAANRALAYLSKAFSLAIDWGLIDVSPCTRIEKYKERKVERYLTDDEIRRLRDVTNEMLGEGYHPPALALPWFLLFTGLRVGEAKALDWDDIDFDACQVHLRDSKVGERTVPVSEAALNVLRGLDRLGPFPFHLEGDPEKRIANHKTRWDQIRKRAGLDDVRTHDLRHTHASLLVRKGVHLSVIQSILGHSVPTTTARYIHTDRSQERAALASVAEEISD